jgi:hypothetical protein
MAFVLWALHGRRISKDVEQAVSLAMREDVCAILETFPAQFDGFQQSDLTWGRHVDLMKKTSTFADHASIIATSILLGISFNVWSVFDTGAGTNGTVEWGVRTTHIGEMEAALATTWVARRGDPPSGIAVESGVLPPTKVCMTPRAVRMRCAGQLGVPMRLCPHPVVTCPTRNNFLLQEIRCTWPCICQSAPTSTTTRQWCREVLAGYVKAVAIRQRKRILRLQWPRTGVGVGASRARLGGASGAY